MTSWNDIPFDEKASPAEKAREFDLQVQENTDLDAGTNAVDDYEKQTGDK